MVAEVAFLILLGAFIGGWIGTFAVEVFLDWNRRRKLKKAVMQLEKQMKDAYEQMVKAKILIDKAKEEKENERH